ncbi:MAG: hypothetical protein KR126chlam2_00435 [Chlamydiae bacterium]|nr:hypothetical protein [Chlamydiota bacterium]
MRSEYFRESYLASEEIDTPDPSRHCFRGQQIVVHWAEPCRASREIVLTVRYGNRELETFCHPIKKKHGYWIYRLVNDDYWNHGGIVSYKVELYEAGVLVDHKEHHLWAEIINISDTPL